MTLPQPDFSRFYRHTELLALLDAYVTARPGLVERLVIGHSHEGREIVALALTRQTTGRHQDKPALWVDGNIHAAELLASTAALYYLHRLLSGYGEDAAITRLLDTRTVYLVPRLNPDGAELALAQAAQRVTGALLLAMNGDSRCAVDYGAMLAQHLHHIVAELHLQALRAIHGTAMANDDAVDPDIAQGGDGNAHISPRLWRDGPCRSGHRVVRHGYGMWANIDPHPLHAGAEVSAGHDTRQVAG